MEIEDLRAVHAAIKEGDASWSDYLQTDDPPTSSKPVEFQDAPGEGKTTRKPRSDKGRPRGVDAATASTEHPENVKEGTGEPQGSAPDQGGLPWQDSPERIEFLKRGEELDELWKSNGFKMVEAQKALGFATGHAWPPSLDGRVILIDETRKLMGEGGK